MVELELDALKSTLPHVLTVCLHRVASFLPLLQQVGGAVGGGGVHHHHVPVDLVGGPHRAGHSRLPPGLRALQETWYTFTRKHTLHTHN